MAEPADPRWNGFSEPSSTRADLLRYALAAISVLCAVAALASSLGRSAPADSASDVDSAVMIDLPPAEASARPAGDDGPEQQAALAAIAQPTAQPTSEAASAKPDDPLPLDPPSSDPQPEAPPPPVASVSAAVLPPPPRATPPMPAAPPPSPAQAQTGPSGADAKVETDADASDEAVHRASAKLITIWQKSLMQRLERAKHALGHATRGVGTVGIAFAIDSGGHLVSERVARSSGSAGLDEAALALVEHAAPFPVPPTGAGAEDLSFVVPVVFKR